MDNFKRYTFALVILLFIALIMLFSTIGIKSLGDKLVKDSNGAINPNERSRGLK